MLCLIRLFVARRSRWCATEARMSLWTANPCQDTTCTMALQWHALVYCTPSDHKWGSSSSLALGDPRVLLPLYTASRMLCVRLWERRTIRNPKWFNNGSL